jgi:hypothetical protein
MADYAIAACRSPEVDPEIFFTLDPEDEPNALARRRENGRRDAAARKVCARCPIRQECLEENLDAEYGVYGGLGPLSRRQLRSDLPYVDMIAVERAVDRDTRVLPSLTMADRNEVVRILARRGAGSREIADVLGMKRTSSARKAVKRLQSA